MIVDKIENAQFYFPLSPGIKKGLQYLLREDLTEKENGKYEIDGENVFVSIQDYETKPESEGRFEAHKKYIDIQFIIKGKEKLGRADIRDCTFETEYDEENDIVFLNGSGSFVNAHKGTFLIFTPDDAHMPCLSQDEKNYVKKAVVKVLMQ